MFAIIITSETIPKIVDAGVMSQFQTPLLDKANNRNRYFIRGYVDQRGRVHSWTILPGELFKETFEYDEDKIQHDWDQIVRLADALT